MGHANERGMKRGCLWWLYPSILFVIVAAITLLGFVVILWLGMSGAFQSSGR
jgi:hypothetical protein